MSDIDEIEIRVVGGTMSAERCFTTMRQIIERVTKERDQLVERLEGVKPELPPRPPRAGMSKTKIVHGWEIPEGYMLVCEEWQPIMDEIDRRASKEYGLEYDFTVEILSEEYRALDEAEYTPIPKGERE